MKAGGNVFGRVWNKHYLQKKRGGNICSSKHSREDFRIGVGTKQLGDWRMRVEHCKPRAPEVSIQPLKTSANKYQNVY